MPEQTQAEKDAAERVSKAAWINDETYGRLHQYDKEDFGVKSADDRRKSKARKPKASETP